MFINQNIKITTNKAKCTSQVLVNSAMWIYVKQVEREWLNGNGIGNVEQSLKMATRGKKSGIVMDKRDTSSKEK